MKTSKTSKTPNFKKLRAVIEKACSDHLLALTQQEVPEIQKKYSKQAGKFIPVFPPENEPSIIDVCTGRGKTNWNHYGNISFRKIIQDIAPIYHQTNRKEKTWIIENVVKIMRSRGCYFLEEKKNGMWVDIGMSRARDKVAHAIRDQDQVIKRKKEIQELKKLATKNVQPTPPLLLCVNRRNGENSSANDLNAHAIRHQDEFIQRQKEIEELKKEAAKDVQPISPLFLRENRRDGGKPSAMDLVKSSCADSGEKTPVQNNTEFGKTDDSDFLQQTQSGGVDSSPGPSVVSRRSSNISEGSTMAFHHDILLPQNSIPQDNYGMNSGNNPPFDPDKEGSKTSASSAGLYYTVPTKKHNPLLAKAEKKTGIKPTPMPTPDSISSSDTSLDVSSGSEKRLNTNQNSSVNASPTPFAVVSSNFTLN